MQDSRLLQKSELSNKKPVFIIAVPRYHENLFRHIKEADEWLSETTTHKPNKTQHAKKITTKQDFEKLEKLILDLRTEKSELFIDEDYHPKPNGQTIANYLFDFLKTKSVNTHYTFTTYYRITVYPFDTEPEDYLRTVTHESDTRQEYIIIPLLIRLKRGKTFEQSRMISGLDGEGNVIIQKVNPKHFYIEREEPEDEELEEDRRVKMEFITS